MHKKIILLILSLIFIISCSSPSNPDNGNEGNNGGSTVPPPTGPTEEELIAKYGIDIGQEDTVISQKIEENLKAYYTEMGSYRVIFTGTPKNYSVDSSLSALILEVAERNNINNIDVDIKNIDFKNGAIESNMFEEGIGTYETIVLNFIFPENKITTIKSSAFYMLTSLREITIPDSVTTIEPEAFYYCSKLEKLILGNNIQTIGDQAFLYAESLKELLITPSVISIGMGAFANSGIIQITMPDSVKTVGDYAFTTSQNLTTFIYYGTSPNTINNKDALSFCAKLTTLILPNVTNPVLSEWQNFLGGNFTEVKQN